MAKKKQSQENDAPDAVREFFDHVIKHHGRGVIYIDTGAILDAFSEKDDLLRFLNEWDGGLITSSFVVVETVRRVTKTRGPVNFKGPAGERGRDLAFHFLSDWLTERKVIVLTVPEAVFDVARAQFPGIKRIADCDLGKSASSRQMSISRGSAFKGFRSGMEGPAEPNPDRRTGPIRANHRQLTASSGGGPRWKGRF